MWVLSEVREKVCDFQKLPLDKSHFITERMRKNVIAASLVLSLAGLMACSAQNTDVKTTTEGTKETSNGDVQVIRKDWIVQMEYRAIHGV